MSLATAPEALVPPGAAPANPFAGLAARIDRPLGLLVESLAAALVLAEIVVLFAGVLARYVFHTPLVWSDELASILFLWLSMLGAVVALRRGEHMRMTAVVGKVGPAARRLLEALAIAASLAFLALVLWPAYEYAADEAFIVTPALEVSNAWRAAAIPVGVALMLVFGALRLARLSSGREIALTLGAVALVVAAFWLARPVFASLGKLNLIVFFLVVVAVNVFSGVPIAFSFALATFGYLALTTSTPMVVMVGRMDEGMSHLIMLAVPLFIFLGALIEMTGMAKAMIQFLASLLGHVRGGLSYVLIGAMYLVSGISGSKIADMAAIAPVLFPEMKKRGAKPGDLVALLSATGAQTETIPPSIVLITIGSVTGVSIAALFTGGMVPALVLGLCLCSVVWWRYRKEDLSAVMRFSWGQIGRFLLIALHRHGVGPDAVGLLDRPGALDGRHPGRLLRLPRHLHPGLHRAGLRTGGHPGDRAVRPAAVPDRPGGRRASGALRHGRDLRHGHRPVRPAHRRRLLRRLRRRQGRSQRGHPLHRRLHGRAAGRPGAGRGDPLVLDRLPGQVTPSTAPPRTSRTPTTTTEEPS